MMKVSGIFLMVTWLALCCGPSVYAQDTEPAGDDDGSSEQVEQRDESYRRQMELEDARSRDRTYIDNTYSQPADLEKIDKLPEESRDNIRDQLVDVIMENGDWKPGDVLEEYPYQPTGAAEADPELMEKEQEAWDEQIEKYHQREAAAFGTHRGPVPGPGNPDGPEGGEQGGEQGNGQGGQDGGEGESGESGKSSAGTYQPYESSASSTGDEVSTAGVSESALDFLRGGQGQQPPQGDTAQAQAQTQAQENSEQLAEQSAEQAEEQASAEQQQESQQETQPDIRGIIAIQDLDKLEGTEIPEVPEDQKEPEDP